MLNKPLLFSASMLQDYRDCARRFDLKYIQNQLWPAIHAEPISEYEEIIKNGQRFHHLVHQYFSGIPAETIQKNISSVIISKWFRQFFGFIENQGFEKIHSEIRVSAQLETHRLVAVYDMITQINNSEIRIFDWKTSKRILKSNQLLSQIQSAIYPFILYENAKTIFPEIQESPDLKIRMDYWFPEFPDDPVYFEYNAADHLHNIQEIGALLDEIEESRSAGVFPKTSERGKCKYCQFRSFCDRGKNAGNFYDIESYSLIDDIDIRLDDLQAMDPEF